MTRRVVLVGDVDGPAAAELAEHCTLVRAESRAAIVVDMSHVRACDSSGLDVLVALHTGDPVSDVTFEGVRWSLFFDALIATPLEDVGQCCHQVRQLVWSSRRVRHVV